MTLLVSACGLLIGAAIGGLVAWARILEKLFAGGVEQAYAALFRGLPELLIVDFVYFGSSALLTGTANALGHEGFVGVPASQLARSRSAPSRAPIRPRCSAPLILPSPRRARGRGQRRHESGAAVSPHHPPQVLRFALPGLGNLWQVALEGFLADLGHRLDGAHADRPGRRRLDPSAFRVLPWRRRALSRDDGCDDPLLRRR